MLSDGHVFVCVYNIMHTKMPYSQYVYYNYIICIFLGSKKYSIIVVMVCVPISFFVFMFREYNLQYMYSKALKKLVILIAMYVNFIKRFKLSLAFT